MKRTWRDRFSVSSPFTHPRIGSRKGTRKNLFPFLENPTLSLDCACELKSKTIAPSLRNSTNWLQRDFQTRFTFCLRKWKTPPRRTAKASSKRRACFVLFRCWIDMVQNISIYNFYQHRKCMLYMILNHFSNYTSQSKAVLSALLSAAYANAFLISVDKRNG